MTTDKIKIKLQGHEKFGLRDGWLTKGFRLVDEGGERNVFISENATDVFGIGKNMVKSLRYWMRAFNLTVDRPNAPVVLSDLGKTIYLYDRYLEDDFTLWVLHSQISKNITEATSWYMFFNYCTADELTKDQIVAILNREIEAYAEGKKFSKNSLVNDVDVMLHMYSRNREKNDPEEKTTSPFSELGLLRKTGNTYLRLAPDNRRINEWIILYEVACALDNELSISIEQLCKATNGIERIYHLSNVRANELLDKLDDLRYIRVNRTAGLDMIYVETPLDPLDVIRSYYNQR